MRRGVWLVCSLLAALGVVALLAAGPARAAAPRSVPVTIVNDDAAGEPALQFATDGGAVDAHTFDLRNFAGVWYRYGEPTGCGYTYRAAATKVCGFAVYTSPDLHTWTNRGLLFDPTTPWFQQHCGAGLTTPVSGCFAARVVHAGGRYVLWFNSRPGGVNSYDVWTSGSPLGPFSYLRTVDDSACAYSNPGLFQDGDGTVYLAGNYCTVRLTPDATDLTSDVSPRYGLGDDEAVSEFTRGGRYYVVEGGRAAYPADGVPLESVSGPSALGPWSAPVPLSPDTCGGQPDVVTAVPVVGGTDYLLTADRYTGSLQEGLATSWTGPLDFAPDGSLLPLDCVASTSFALTAGAAATVTAPLWADQSSGSDGFRPAAGCLVSAVSQVAETFRPARSGVLDTVSLTAARLDPAGSVTVSVTAVTHGVPTRTLARVPAAAPTWSEAPVTVSTGVPVRAGVEYAVVLSSTGGCLSPAVDGADPYRRGTALVLSGSRWEALQGTDFRFATTVRPAGADVVRAVDATGVRRGPGSLVVPLDRGQAGLGITLRGAGVVGSLVLRPDGPSGFPTDVTVEARDSRGRWVTVSRVRALPVAPVRLRLAPVRATRLRVLVRRTSGGAAVHLAAVEAYGQTV